VSFLNTPKFSEKKYNFFCVVKHILLINSYKKFKGNTPS